MLSNNNTILFRCILTEKIVRVDFISLQNSNLEFSRLMWSKRFFSQNRNENQWNWWNLPERRAVAECFVKNRFKIWLSNEKAFCWFEYIRSDLGFANFAFRSEIITKVSFEKLHLSIDSLVSNLVCNIIVRFEIKFHFNSIFIIFLAWKISIKHKMSISRLQNRGIGCTVLCPDLFWSTSNEKKSGHSLVPPKNYKAFIGQRNNY